MFVRTPRIVILAVLGLLAAGGEADAFGRRPTATCWYYSPHWHCPCPPAPRCHYYHYSEPVERLGGPYHMVVRQASVGYGVIVQVDYPAGTYPAPADVFNVIQSGAGQVKYEGWNKQVLNPGLPGGTVRYSFFLCPVRSGDVTVEVGFVMANNTMVNVPFKFHVH